MRLNVEFKEGIQHTWLIADGSVELFIQRPMESLDTTHGHLTCWVPSSQMEEIRESVHEADFEKPDSVFLCCASQEETKLYAVEESVTFAGGDVLLFVKPIATFH